MTKKIDNYQELVDMVKDKHVVVFGGYSGLGYETPNLIEAKMKEDLQQYIAKYGKANLAIVAGATPEGVGSIYKVASSMGLQTYGIVSNAALEYSENPADKNCDFVLYSKQPPGVWTVKDDEGKSLMVDIATQGRSGNLHYYNGGDVSLEEIKEAQERGVDFQVNYQFKPNPQQVAKRVAKNPNFIAEPLLSLQKESILQNVDKLRSDSASLQNTENKPSI